MTIYILRHASAGSRRRNPLLDRKRGLDKEGKQQCLLIGAYLNAMRVLLYNYGLDLYNLGSGQW